MSEPRAPSLPSPLWGGAQNGVRGTRRALLLLVQLADVVLCVKLHAELRHEIEL
jgi:hypothetical protein